MKIIQKIYRPGIDGPVFTKPVPRTDHGSREEVEREGYSIRIINRGEQLSYIDATLGEVVAEIFIPSAWIDADSIKLWDGERPVTGEQRAVILERIARFWPTRCDTPLRVIHGAQP
jgi:hypothetical protein